MSASNSRRNFFKAAAIGGISALALSSIATAQEKRRAKPGAGSGGDLDLPLVKPGAGMAASMNYFHSKSDVKNNALKTDRQGLPFDQQSCAGCMLYTSVGKKDGEEVGKCSIFANQLVKGQGWCASFSKKA